MISRVQPLVFVCSALLAACNTSEKSAPAPVSQEPAAALTPAAVASVAEPLASAKPQPPDPLALAAKVGEAAPDFTLQDLDGKSVSLASLRGKTVVLEWFNPQCPFVKLSHTKGSLIDTAARQSKNAVQWLAINSGAPGKQGHGVEVNREGQKAFGLQHPILLDESGKVGKAYGAERTPTVIVINAEGVIAYRGAIDNSPDGEKKAPTGGVLINHVDAALADLAAKRPVANPETPAYGCRVKYADL